MRVPTNKVLFAISLAFTQDTRSALTVRSSLHMDLAVKTSTAHSLSSIA
jgi:hypothetical protein